MAAAAESHARTIVGDKVFCAKRDAMSSGGRALMLTARCRRRPVHANAATRRNNTLEGQ